VAIVANLQTHRAEAQIPYPLTRLLFHGRAPELFTRAAQFQSAWSAVTQDASRWERRGESSLQKIRRKETYGQRHL